MSRFLFLVLLPLTLCCLAGGPQPKPLPDGEALKKLPADGGPDWNRLVFESSPYLLQHASNPVDWYPWGEAAFARAEKENKPIFLSIGYATCHWCHVMEHESFEDPEVAALLNQYFVCIKVDREERPDLDEVYMTACQAISGQAGWPLTLMLDHQRRPYFAGTYFPKTGSTERPGLMQLVPQMAELWQNGREVTDQFGVRLVDHLSTVYQYTAGEAAGTATLDKAFNQLKSRYDSVRGGFGTSPKFPIPHNLNFLLRYWKRTHNAQALEMVRNTLLTMGSGGIYDHLGYGFHRYSTDPHWRVPHFEKMLYDQALLAMAYLETYQATGEPGFARTAREIFTYVLRDMTAPEGGFYSAEDADSNGTEGLFYLWTYEEVLKIAGEQDGPLFCRFYNLKAEGNFRALEAGHKGLNILYQNLPVDLWARQESLDPVQLEKTLAAVREKLFVAREKRVRPFKDDKILTDWNGLMIAALAMGGRILNEPKYTAAAKKAADFMLTGLRSKDGRLLKRYRQGKASLPAHLADYAYLTWGLLELYEAGFESRYLEQAGALTADSLNLFWDGEDFGFFMTAADGEPLLVRPKSLLDNALPAGNSVAAMNLLRLAHMTGTMLFEEKARELIGAFGSRINQAPSSLCQMMQALDFLEGPSYEVVIAGKADDAGVIAMLTALNQAFLPNKVVILRPPGEHPITGIAAYTKNQLPLEGKATAYVCRNFACKLPTTEIMVMLEHLGQKPEKSN